MNETITMILDEPAEEFDERLGSFFTGSTHSTGLKPLYLDLKKGSNRIELKVGDGSVVFDNPLGISVYMDKFKKINHIFFHFGISKEGKTPHRQARDTIYKILKDISDAGWKRYLDESSVRLCGRDVLEYNANKHGRAPVNWDENYILTDEEWFKYTYYNWEFYYKNLGFLEIKLDREGLDRSMEGSDGYYLSIQISSTDNTFRYTHRKEEDRNNWKELYKQEIPRFNKMRDKDEKEAIAEGFRICDEYVEPLMNFGIFDENEKGNLTIK